MLKICVEDASENVYGPGNPCMNDGEYMKPDPEKGEKANYTCSCLPAFEGKLCEKEKNPCIKEGGDKFCHPFKCARAPEDIYKGFR
ncbi:unnamed protein product [Dibothriocephalus latus]|uniref:EGF-like domain-containing protein n=1 Tax=Dibothriocephalus latus TaxID=60516 RepID=A0A3P7N322_DIBLA|nr:unnamed protein product [Dibothriocephalus latus]